MLAHIRPPDRARRRRLCLDAQRAHARPRRAPSAPATRGTCASTSHEEYRALGERHFEPASTCSGSSTPASCARTSSRSRSSAGTGSSTPRSTSPKPFYDRFTPAISARDFVLRRARLDRSARSAGGAALSERAVRESLRAICAMSRRASSCTPTCRTSRASVRGRSVRSGCGRRSRPAICRCSTCSTRHPGKVTLSLTPVLCDQLEAPGALARCLAFLREIRPASHALDLAEDPLARARVLPPPATRRPRTLWSAAETCSARLRRTWLHVPRHLHAVRRLAGHPCVRLQLETGIASHRARFGGWEGGFWLPGVRARPMARRAAGGGRRAHDVRRLDGRDAEPGAYRSPGGKCSLRSTGRRSTASGRRPCTRPTATTATRTGSPRRHQAWANDGTPYDPERGAARAPRPRPRLRRAPARRALRRGLRHRALRPLLARGRDVARSPCSSWPTSAARSPPRSPPPAPEASRRRAGARAATCARGARTRPRLDSSAARSSAALGARCPRSVPCASCSRSRAPTGRSSSPTCHRRRVPARARRGPPRRVRSGAARRR